MRTAFLACLGDASLDPLAQDLPFELSEHREQPGECATRILTRHGAAA